MCRITAVMTEPSDEKADKAPLTFELFGLSGGIHFSQGLFFACVGSVLRKSGVLSERITSLVRFKRLRFSQKLGLNHVNPTGAYLDSLWEVQELAAVKRTWGIFVSAWASVVEKTFDLKRWPLLIRPITFKLWFPLLFKPGEWILLIILVHTNKRWWRLIGGLTAHDSQVWVSCKAEI